MKKKVLVVASDMEIGGAERALLGLLDAFDTDRYSVDLFLLRHSGPFMKLIPQKINILPENSKYACIAAPIKGVLKKRGFGVAYGRLKGKIKARNYLKKNHVSIQNSVGTLYSFKYTMKYLPMISDNQYDLAIGYTTPYYIIEKKTKAKKKVVWIHTDYSKEYSDIENEEKAWMAYDYLVGVSETVCERFASKYEKLRPKIIEMDNIVSASIIQEQALEKDVINEMPKEESVNLLSIGRFCYAKNFESIPIICKRLIDNGLKIKWYLIGFGNDEHLIRECIKKNGMEKNVIILGKKDNPYPYIKACDIYVQPSRFEGRCVTVTEAQILNKPVIITNYPTAISQLKDGYDGVIVPLDNEGCADAIIKVILNPNLRTNLIKATALSDYTNKEEIEKLYNLI